MVLNVHQRLIQAPLSAVGNLIDRLASSDDRFWPGDRWPAIRFDRPLAVGAAGGHGPIRYFVEVYVPGHSITFRFTGPRGFHGTHGFTAEEDAARGGVRLRHELRMRTGGVARLTWPLLFRWLHDALLEDALDRAEAFGEAKPVHKRTWSWQVRFLRALLTLRSRRRQLIKPSAAGLSGR